MEMIFKVAVGVFFGLVLWSAKESLGSMFLLALIIGAVLLALLLAWFILKSSASSLYATTSYLYAKVFVVPKIVGFVTKNSLIESRDVVLLEGAIHKFWGNESIERLITRHRKVQDWRVKGLSTSQEDQEIGDLVRQLIEDYKYKLKIEYRDDRRY
jgi:hypothetical protein